MPRGEIKIPSLSIALSESEFEKLFGAVCKGRPPSDSSPVGVATGNPVITEKARRRAMRVLRARHAAEFEQLMEAEANWLKTNGGSP